MWGRNGDELGLPRSIEKDSQVARSFLQRLSFATGRPLDQLVQSVFYSLADVIDLRGIEAGWIPFTAAATVIRKGRDALRATATTAMGVKSDLQGNYSAQGEQILKSAQMTHTRDGSFVFPVVIHLTPFEATLTPGIESLFGDEEERARYEPPERRVTRTFAEAFATVANRIAPKEPSSLRQTDMLECVRAGVSREFCRALGGILSDPNVATLETSFQWASNGPSSTSLPTSVELRQEHAPTVARAAELLKRERVQYSDFYSGRIIRMVHVDEAYYLTIQTVRNGRLSRIDVTVSREQHDAAAPWYLAGRTVALEGTVRPGRGRQWIMDKPVRLHPLDVEHLEF